MKRFSLLLGSLILSIALPSCVGFYLNENTYQATSEGTDINGADVKIALKPMGGKSYGSISALVVGIGAGSTDGPFIWRVEATGQEGVHESIWVNFIQVSTSETERSEPLPQEYLGGETQFIQMKGKDNADKSFANHQFPGKLEVYPKKDGEISIKADISVKTVNGQVRRKVLKYTLSPDSSKGFESVFIPTEIINSFGGEDPTEWDW